MTLAANLLLMSLRQSRSLAVGRKRAMLSSVSSVMPSPSRMHIGAENEDVHGPAAGQGSRLASRRQLYGPLWAPLISGAG